MRKLSSTHNTTKKQNTHKQQTKQATTNGFHKIKIPASRQGRVLYGWNPKRDYCTISLSFLRACTFTTVRAGLALILVSSLVLGLLFLCVLVAFFLIVLILNRPGILNSPGPFGLM